MGVPVLVQLTDEVRQELEAQAQSRGVGLEALLSDLAAHAAREAWRARVRQESQQVAQDIARSPESQAFYDFWGTPDSRILP
jgi:hypothetical protein